MKIHFGIKDEDMDHYEDIWFTVNTEENGFEKVVESWSIDYEIELDCIIEIINFDTNEIKKVYIEVIEYPNIYKTKILE